MIIPNNPTVQMHATLLLKHMQDIPTPSEEQRRFIGTLRKAMGMQSNNERHKSK